MKRGTGSALFVGLAIVLLLWGVEIAFAVEVNAYLEEAKGPTENKTYTDGQDAAAIFVIVGLIGCLLATAWLANLVNTVITGKGIDA